MRESLLSTKLYIRLPWLGVTVAKVLLVDTASADMLLRVLSFVVVGLLLLMVSFAYHKMALQGGSGRVGIAGVGGAGEIE